ncbi:hypothetical protein L9F63_017765, partial [Diploptera punctata]
TGSQTADSEVNTTAIRKSEPATAFGARGNSTGQAFANKYDYHLPTGVFVIWSSAAFVLLIAAAIIVTCLEWSACPLYRHRNRNNNAMLT